jgi:hypothetical protein
VSAALAVINRLEDVAAVTALVPTTRIVQGVLPQNPTLPAILVQEITEVRGQHLRGDAGIVRHRVQIDSYASGGNPVSDAKAIDAAIVGDASGTSLLGFKGEVDGIMVHNVEPAGKREQYEGEELREYRVSRDVIVSWSQP